jgi:helicase
MAFRATFIGINKHQAPGILELTGATRDAQALHALFNDTFSGIDSRLLIDEAATLSSIRAALDASLGEALPDDVVVLTFAGHGTPGHQIVAFDTDSDSPGDSSLSMTELAERFRSSKARAVLCILDCCFSGAAPARVLTAPLFPAPTSLIIPRSPEQVASSSLPHPPRNLHGRNRAADTAF